MLKCFLPVHHVAGKVHSSLLVNEKGRRGGAGFDKHLFGLIDKRRLVVNTAAGAGNGYLGNMQWSRLQWHQRHGMRCAHSRLKSNGSRELVLNIQNFNLGTCSGEIQAYLGCEQALLVTTEQPVLIVDQDVVVEIAGFLVVFARAPVRRVLHHQLECCRRANGQGLGIIHHNLDCREHLCGREGDRERDLDRHVGIHKN